MDRFVSFYRQSCWLTGVLDLRREINKQQKEDISISSALGSSLHADKNILMNAHLDLLVNVDKLI